MYCAVLIGNFSIFLTIPNFDLSIFSVAMKMAARPPVVPLSPMPIKLPW
jgi:hypothetical protein